MGRATVARRYNCLTEGDWGNVVEMWERDMARMEGRGRGRRRGEGDEELKPRLRREVVGLIKNGQLGRGINRVISPGLADAEHPLVLQQLRVKFPDRQDQLPASVPLLTPIDSFPSLREKLLALNPALHQVVVVADQSISQL